MLKVSSLRFRIKFPVIVRRNDEAIQSKKNRHLGSLLSLQLTEIFKTTSIFVIVITLFLPFFTPSLKAQNVDIDTDIPSDTTVILTNIIPTTEQDTIISDDTVQTKKQDTIILNNTSQQNANTSTTNDVKAKPVVTSNKIANPHWATLWSLFPGGGQVYNWHYGDKWWIASLKLTAIYGGFGTLTYFVIRNTNDYREFRDAYKWVSSKGISGKENQYTDGYSVDQLQSYMNYYQSNVEWCYFFTFLLYGLQIVEATVTAHLLTFDVSDNLSLSVKPQNIQVFSSPSLNKVYGLSLRYKIQYK